MKDVLRNIVARASSIEERLSPDFIPIDDQVVDARMRAWRRIAANDDAERFERRLAWDGLNEATARKAVGPVRLRPDAEMPRWAMTLAEVLQISNSTRPRERCLDDRAPVPFEDLLTPFVTWARAACERQAGAACSHFAYEAHRALERQLLNWLSSRAARALWMEFSIELLDHSLEADSSAAYRAFVDRMLSGDLVFFFEEYSVLARVLSNTSQLWVEATVEMLGRFASDAREIRERFGIQGELTVTDVATSLSDPHHGLRSVAILSFASGDRIVYKPRSLGVEVAWNALLDRFSQFGQGSDPLDFRTFRVLDCGDHGWAEYVAYAPCEDEESVRRYFTRAGALLAVVHMLHGTDCHGDNLVFAGEHPMVIDVETILSPLTRDPLPVGSEAPRLARRRLTSSVLSTYLLPFWCRSIGDGEVYDGSGFGADFEQDVSMTTRRWLFINTDRMKFVRAPLETPPSPRAARADGRPLHLYEYEADFVSGFAAMYRFFIRERSALLAPGSPFQRLSGVDVRFVYRRTSIYVAVLEHLKKPELLRDGADRSIEIEQLAMASLTSEKFDDRPGWREIWNTERQAMERGDVPYFSAFAGDNSLAIGTGREVADWFARSSHAAAVERLVSLDESDLAFQSDLIRSAIRSRIPVGAVYDRPKLPSFEIVAGHRPPLQSEFLNEAIRIAGLLDRNSVRGEDGSLCWFQPVWSREFMVERPDRELDVAGFDLYDGATGIGLFLAAAHRVTGRSDLRSLAIGAVQPVLVELRERGEETAQLLGIGGMSGLGSMVYGLVSMSTLLDDPELLAAAERAAGLITRERIEADSSIDVTLGSAGALLGLLTLHNKNKNPSTLAAARMCADRIVARLEPADENTRSVRTVGGRFLTGFSHGAAGMAYALCRLHAVSPDSNLVTAARSLMGFERAAFSVQHDDWPDLRQSGPPRFMASWCHGAPGIALGRIASAGVIEEPEMRLDIERALAITTRQGIERADYLCCGSFGIVDILWTAGNALRRPDLRDRARRLAGEIVGRANAEGQYRLDLPSVGQLQCVGLFRGLAGIGYALLRIARPDVVPAVLQMQPR